MRISKIFNNNVVGVIDLEGREQVVMGKGIGFQKKANDVIDEKLVDKVFNLSSKDSTYFEKLASEIPYSYIKLSDKIITLATKRIGKKLNKHIYITLTDHLNFAIERKKKGITFQNALLWEIKKFYSLEFNIGLEALQIIKKTLDIDLTEDEAGFIALHIVNAQVDGKMYSAKTPEILQDILNIVKYSIGTELDENSLSYERFVTHLKFFIQRIFKNDLHENQDQSFYEEYLKKFPDATKCARKIGDYTYKKLDYKISTEELMYLTLHISRFLKYE